MIKVTGILLKIQLKVILFFPETLYIYIIQPFPLKVHLAVSLFLNSRENLVSKLKSEVFMYFFFKKWNWEHWKDIVISYKNSKFNFLKMRINYDCSSVKVFAKNRHSYFGHVMTSVNSYMDMYLIMVLLLLP